MTPISEAARKAAEAIHTHCGRELTRIETTDLRNRRDYAAQFIQRAIDAECAARDALISELRGILAEAFDETPIEDYPRWVSRCKVALGKSSSTEPRLNSSQSEPKAD